MKLTGKNMPPGEWAFKALVKEKLAILFGENVTTQERWRLTDQVYFSVEEVKAWVGNTEFKWPVEEYEGGMIYVPTKEELEND